MKLLTVNYSLFPQSQVFSPFFQGSKEVKTQSAIAISPRPSFRYLQHIISDRHELRTFTSLYLQSFTKGIY
ncbi:MAG: hypothetical protein ACRCT1_16720 [Microcoleaceae cyanobacterium]